MPLSYPLNGFYRIGFSGSELSGVRSNLHRFSVSFLPPHAQYPSINPSGAQTLDFDSNPPSLAEMLRSCGAPLLRRSRGFCTTTSSASQEKIVAAVLFERLPLVFPKIDPAFYAFQLFSFRWGRMAEKGKKKRRNADQEGQQQQALEIPESIAKGDCEIVFNRVPWSGKADESGNRRSPMRSLDKRLYLLLYGCPYGAPYNKPVWHFPEKVYESEATLRQCAELALKATIGDLSHANFIGNAPIGHLVIQNEGKSEIESFKRFFFKSQVLGLNKFSVENCQDFVWVTKDEIMEYFPEQAGLFKRMIIG